MGQADYDEVANDVSERVNEYTKKALELMHVGFAAELSFLFEFMLSTFNTGLELSRTHAEKRMSGRLNADLTAKRSQLSEYSAGLTVEKVLLGTLQFLQRAKRMKPVCLTHGSRQLMSFRNGKCETEFHSTRGFSEIKLKDTQRLCMANKLTKWDAKVIKRTRDSLISSAKGVESGLQTLSGPFSGHISQRAG